MTISLIDRREARSSYPTDLTDAEWRQIVQYLPEENLCGRPRKHQLREILDAIFCVIRGGCAWRLLPHDFPPWGTVYYWFRQWRLDGLWRAYADEKLRNWCEEWTGWRLEVVRRNAESSTFEVVPRRWVVERSIGWICRNRRLAKD